MRKPVTEEERDIVRQHWATMSTTEIEHIFGMSRKRSQYIAARLHLHKDASTMRRLLKANAVKATVSIKAKMSDASYREAMGEQKRRLYRSEYRRVMEGKPQRTRLRLAKTTRRASHAISQLVCNRGYIRDGQDPYCLRYDERTQRPPKDTRCNEAYYTSKYHIIFKSYEDD